MLFNKKLLLQRDSLIFIFIVISFIAIIVKAFHVQVIQSDFLVSEGSKRQIRTLEIQAPRGSIFDRNGSLLALSTPFHSVWIDPKEFSFNFDKQQQQKKILKMKDSLSEKKFKLYAEKQRDKIKNKLTKFRKVLALLNLSERTTKTKILSNVERRFMYLKRGVQPNISKKIEGLKVSNVYIKKEYKRYYPSSEINAHLIGFTNIDDVGLSGFEKSYGSTWLAGVTGKTRIIKDRTGRVIKFVKDIQTVKKGKDLVLSIDSDIQYLLYRALKEAYAEHLPLSVQSVILDAKTGEVLAKASLPAFNPNNREQLTGRRLRNRVVADLIEPGSVIKPFIVAKALDLELVTEDELINTSPGYIRVQGSRLTDTRDHGKLTVAGILKESSNVGIVKVALKLSAKQQWQTFKGVGFGDYLNLSLPSETLGFIKQPEQWQKIDQASSSYGYGFSVNLMQLAKAYSVFASDGVLKPVSLLKHEDGENIDGLEPSKQVFSKEVANKVLQMLEAVVKKGGTAPKARINGYRVAGKTGTAHKVRGDGRGYYANKYLSSFVGIVPVSNPKYIMATVVNEPSRGIYYGGLVAAPIFKKVMEEVLRLKNIEPDNDWSVK